MIPAAESVGPTGSVVGVDLAAKKTSHKKAQKAQNDFRDHALLLNRESFCAFCAFCG